VYPSLWENFPNVCLEAMSAARAVIGSSAGGMAEMLDEGACGRLVDPHDYKNLARQIISLLDSPRERIRLGQLARSKVLSAYNEEHIGEATENIYLEAIRLKS
jgi:glycosyltransferase involved in cell wall biosynthesis